MRELVQWAAAAGLRDSLLLLLIGVIAALAVGTVAFSAYAIVLRVRNRAHARREEGLRRRWEGPLLAAIADPERAATLHAAVDARHRLHFVGFVLEYARRLRGEEVLLLRSLVRPYLGLVAERAEESRLEVRARAIQTLGTLGLPEHGPRLIRALDDPSPMVAMVAARALARAETPEYADAVLARLERFEGWSPRFLASMLAAMGPQVSASLRERLAEGSLEPWARVVLAHALFLQGDFLAADVAAEVLPVTEDRELQVSLLRLLGAVGRPVHLDLVRSFRDHHDPVVRAQAICALGILGGAEDVPVLLASMSDSFPWAALYGARGARLSGGREALATLAEADDPRAALARQVLAEERDS